MFNKEVFDTSGNHFKNDYNLSRVIYSEDRYSVNLRQSDHSQFTAIFNESEVINFTDTPSDIIGTSSDDYLKSSNDYANEAFTPDMGFDYVDGGNGELDTLIFNGSFDDYFISKIIQPCRTLLIYVFKFI